jgi:hypothetical protein
VGNVRENVPHVPIQIIQIIHPDATKSASHLWRALHYAQVFIPASPAGTYTPSGAPKGVPIHQHPALIAVRANVAGDHLDRYADLHLLFAKVGDPFIGCWRTPCYLLHIKPVWVAKTA